MDGDRLAVLNVCIEAGIPVLLWGEPGTAKTSVIESMCRSLDRELDPSDFAGLPVVRPEGVIMHAPAWARRLSELKSKRGALLLDEVNQAAPAVQAALMRVVLDREVGDLSLDPNLPIIAAANPPHVGAGAYELAHPFANRFLHMPWQVDLRAWAEGLLAGFPDVPARRLPEGGVEKLMPEIKAFIVGFLRKHPALAQQLPKPDEEIRAYPTLRSWHMMAARGLAAAKAMGYGLDTQVAHLILTATALRCPSSATRAAWICRTRTTRSRTPARTSCRSATTCRRSSRRRSPRRVSSSATASRSSSRSTSLRPGKR